MIDVSMAKSRFDPYVIKKYFAKSVDISMESTYGSGAHLRSGGARPVRVRLGWGGPRNAPRTPCPIRGISPDGLLYQAGFLVLAIAKMGLVFPMA